MHTQQQQATVVTTQPQYVVQPYQTAPIVSSYSHVQSTIIGIALIIVGILSIIFNIADVTIGSSFSNTYTHYSYNILSTYSNGVIGHGFWCGILVSIIFRVTLLDYLEGRF